jgi:predicted secreted Zn-dependent protease
MRKNWVALVLTVAFAATMTLLGLGPGGSAAPTSSSDRSKARETIKYYDVRGTTIEELRHEVYSRGPYDSTGQRFAGWAEWRIRWWYDREQVPQGCKVSRAVTETDIEYTLPRWVEAANAPEELRETWNRFVEALTVHEQGHGDLARALAAEIEFAIRNLPPEPTCEELDRKVNELANRMILEDRTQEAYDLATGHGQTQGAVFPDAVVVHASSEEAPTEAAVTQVSATP